ncbi:MAG: hypothetical protein RJA11_1181 [Bacteroidota bacterium]|jgi:hypothetical protein
MYIVHAFIIIFLEYAHKTTNNELKEIEEFFQEITLVIEWQWIS